MGWWIDDPPGARASEASIASPRISTTPRAPCSDVPHPVTTIGSPARIARRRVRASSAATLPTASWRARMRSATDGSASIISVMWNGGPVRALGRSVEAHGSGAPGNGAVGSKAVVSIAEG